MPNSITKFLLATMATMGSMVQAQTNQTVGVLNQVSYGGSGCPQGSLDVVFGKANEFTAVFNGFSVSLGPGVSVTQERKNCQLNLDIWYSANIQYAVTNTTYAGYADLGPDVTAYHQSTFYFSGSSAQSSTRHNFTGPMNEQYLVTEEIPAAEQIWSGCGLGLPLNVNSEVVILSNDSEGAGSVYDPGLFELGIEWRACTP